MNLRIARPTLLVLVLVTLGSGNVYGSILGEYFGYGYVSREDKADRGPLLIKLVISSSPLGPSNVRIQKFKQTGGTLPSAPTAVLEGLIENNTSLALGEGLDQARLVRTSYATDLQSHEIWMDVSEIPGFPCTIRLRDVVRKTNKSESWRDRVGTHTGDQVGIYYLRQVDDWWPPKAFKNLRVFRPPPNDVFVGDWVGFAYKHFGEYDRNIDYVRVANKHKSTGFGLDLASSIAGPRLLLRRVKIEKSVRSGRYWVQVFEELDGARLPDKPQFVFEQAQFGSDNYFLLGSGWLRGPNWTRRFTFKNLGLHNLIYITKEAVRNSVKSSPHEPVDLYSAYRLTYPMFRLD